jgi:hypothetical protein
MSMTWQTLDTLGMLESAYAEQTTGGNVGAYAVPFSQPLRRQSPGPEVNPEELDSTGGDSNCSAYLALDQYLK